MVTQSDAATALTRATSRPSSSDVAPMLSSIVRSSMLMLENALHSYHRTCLQLQPFHSSFITIALARKRSSTLELDRAGERLAFIAAHRCSCYRERFACVTLKYAPLLENASCVHRRPCLQQSLALVVALDACNSPVHTHRALFVPHRRSSYQAYKCIKQRAYIVRSSTLELENFLRSSLLIHAHARVRFACVTLKYAPLLENALRSSSRSCLQQPCAPCCAHSCTLLCTLIVTHSPIIVPQPSSSYHSRSSY